MPVVKTLKTLLVFVAAVSTTMYCEGQDLRKKSRTRPVLPYNHATLNAPPGMVYIRGGSTVIKYNQSTTDTSSNKKVSLTSFFIDKTEITNQQYRNFTEWVADSIAVVKYIKDEKYFLADKPKGEGKPGDENKVSTDTTKIDTVRTTMIAKGVDTSKGSDSVMKKRIDWSKVNHKKIFESKDEDVQNKIKPMLDENGDIKRDAYVFAFTYLRAVNSTNPKVKTRQFVTEAINIYPDEKVWAEDLTNSQTELLVENYFKITPYDDYPVVGVSWKQARAFAYWRSITASDYVNMPEFMKYYHLTYSLPSEAQWVYAASGYFDMIASNTDTTAADSTGIVVDSTVTQKSDSFVAAKTQAVMDKQNKKLADLNSKVKSDIPVVQDSTPIHRDDKGLLSNFKQDEGDYWEDGSALTLPVMAFAPNEFGLYNMDGNVSEWMIDAYSPSTFSFVSDLNPALQYDADSTDADAMRRKVVRGGSFMSNAKSLSPYYRDLELDNVARCYIGFRCVLMAPEVLYRPVMTRKKKLVGNRTNKVSSRRVR